MEAQQSAGRHPERTRPANRNDIGNHRVGRFHGTDFKLDATISTALIGRQL
jgi:hypothetical protein